MAAPAGVLHPILAATRTTFHTMIRPVSMKERERAFLAFLVAPALAGAAYQIMYMVVRGADPSDNMFSQFIVGSAFASVGIYIRAALFGFPIYLLLRHFKKLSLLTLVISGVAIPAGLIVGNEAIGLLASDQKSLFSFYREGCQEILENVRTECGRQLLLRDRILSLATGGFAGLFFWLIYAGGKLSSKQ